MNRPLPDPELIRQLTQWGTDSFINRYLVIKSDDPTGQFRRAYLQSHLNAIAHIQADLGIHQQQEVEDASITRNG